MNSIGFAPVAREDSMILVLGSMPGQKSLEEHQYYAHPRNSFWPVMYTLFNSKDNLDYEQKKQLLLDNKIALWDVLRECYREGSLDSDIDQTTIKVNDFKNFFKQHKNINAIFFNGTKAEQLFRKAVLKELKESYQALNYFRLPSTSPAHAAMKFEEKCIKWEIIKNYISK